jgi:hypothetical protein
VKNLLPGLPLIESPFFNDLVPKGEAELQAIARQLYESGYAVIDFPDDDFAAKVSRIQRKLGPRFDIKAWKTSKDMNLRLQDAWRYDEDVKAIACNNRMRDLLTQLWGRPAVPFQTLNFPVGTEQSMHGDYVHFSSVPATNSWGSKSWVIWIFIRITQGMRNYGRPWSRGTGSTASMD